MSDIEVNIDGSRPMRLTKSGKPDRRGAPGVKKTQVIRRDKPAALPTRRVTLKMCLRDEAQDAKLMAISDAHTALWNWAHGRIDAELKKTGKLISAYELMREMTNFRNQSNIAGLAYSSAAQATISRCHAAWKRHLTKDASGKKFGRPRLKGEKRQTSWEYKAHGSGVRYVTAAEHQATCASTDPLLIDRFAFIESDDERTKLLKAKKARSHGRLYLSGVGVIKVRGMPRNETLRVLNVSISKKITGWYASLVVECQPVRHLDPVLPPVGFDLGSETHVTLAYGPGEYVEIANTRLLNELRTRIKALISKADSLQWPPMAPMVLSSRKRREVRQLRRRAALLYAALERRRLDRAHKLTCDLAKHAVLITEDLDLVSMTASNRPAAMAKRMPKTARPGSPATWPAARKAALTAQVLDTTPGLILRLLNCKAEEAGGHLELLDTRQHKPSQTCPHCYAVGYKEIGERRHSCDCGFTASRDQAAALDMLVVGLKILGMGTVPDGWDWHIPIADSTPLKSSVETATKAAHVAWAG